MGPHTSQKVRPYIVDGECTYVWNLANMAKLDKSMLTSWVAEVKGSLEEDKYNMQ